MLDPAGDLLAPTQRTTYRAVGVRVHFPSGAKLCVGSFGSDTAGVLNATARKEGSSWRLSLTGPAPTAEPRAEGGVYLRPRPQQTSTLVHAVLDAELWQVEHHNKREPIRWEGAPSHGVTDTGSAGQGRATSGAVWQLHGGAYLVIGILPRHLILGDAESAEACAAAVYALQAMVSDLLASSLELSPREPTAREPSIGTLADPYRPFDDSCATQRLARLHKLLEEGGVLDSWAALMADPIQRIDEEHPVTPLGRAKRPVLSGARGPWSIAGGWSPSNPTGNVRDRQVVRTADTPPNRLAVQLAGRVRQALDSIDQQLAALSSDPDGSDLGPPGLHAYSAEVDHLRRQAIAVERSPAFAEVDRSAPLPLDSPTLQTNQRCQPLLRAWSILDRRTQGADQVPIDQLVLEPLRKTYELYELWCAQRLRILLNEALGPNTPEQVTKYGRWVRYQWQTAAGIKVELAASLDGGAEEHRPWARDPRLPRGGGSKHKNSAEQRQTWDEQFRTWGLVGLPDGYLSLTTPGRRPFIIVWDAKYRAASYHMILSGLTYQAHAFRDALRFKFRNHRGEADEQAPHWSLVLHPYGGAQHVPRAFLLQAEGESLDKAEADDDSTVRLGPFGLRDRPDLLDCMREGIGGLGILQARPALADGEDAPLWLLTAAIKAYLLDSRPQREV